MTPSQTHGGNRYDRNIILDFSVNTNPLGMPGEVVRSLRERTAGDTALWEWYPDPFCTSLRESLAACHGVPKEHIVCGNGASELLFAIVRAVKDISPAAVLPIPSFLEYERALLASGVKIKYYKLKERDDFALTDEILEWLTEETDLLILCDPNNPVGNLTDPDLLQRILVQCGEKRITVLLDTCFRELALPDEGEMFSDGASLTEKYPHLILLKAFTKLFAMPGLRLGYAVCGEAAMAGRIGEQLPCWNVSGMAQAAGLTALDIARNTDYISQSRGLITAERKFLADGLTALGLRVLPGQANFLCFSCGGPLYELLLRKGILIRDCSGFRGLGKGWYRIAVRTHEENERLLDELRKLPDRTGAD